MRLSTDAEEHAACIPWADLPIIEQVNLAGWISIINDHDRHVESESRSVIAQCATDLNINLDGDL